MANPIEILGNAKKITNNYYPIGVDIAGYLVNETSVVALLGIFFGGLSVLFGSTYVVV